jgi:hypothetical protein
MLIVEYMPYFKGMPKHTPDFSNGLSAHSKALANTWIEAATSGNNQPLLSAGPQQMEVCVIDEISGSNGHKLLICLVVVSLLLL